MNYAGIKYCPRCGEHIFKTTQLKNGDVLAWCSQCEHTVRISDHDSDPLMTVFEELNQNYDGKDMEQEGEKMTKTDIFTVIGKLNKWDITCGEFTLGTPLGDIKINIEKCENLMLNEMIDAMRNRRNIEIKVVAE